MHKCQPKVVNGDDVTVTWFALVMVLDEIQAGNVGREHETNVRRALWALLGTRCPKEHEKRIENIRELIKIGRLKKNLYNKEEFYTETVNFAKELTDKLRFNEDTDVTA